MTIMNIPSTVNFVIPTESVQTVVTLLLSNNISFSLTAFNHLKITPETTESVVNQSTESTHDILDRLDRKKMILDSLEVIYQKYINGNIEQIPPKESQIAADFGISLGTFKNKFKTVYGKTFYQLYMQSKMEHAKTLLLQGISAAKVSKRIGYSSPIKFNLMFQKYFGMTPKQYQIRHLNKIRTRV